MYQEYGRDSLSNIYNYNFVNKSRKAVRIDMKLISPPGRIHFIGDLLTIPAGKAGNGTFMVVLPRKGMKASMIPVVIGLYDDGEKVEDYHSTFVAPNNLDNPVK